MSSQIDSDAYPSPCNRALDELVQLDAAVDTCRGLLGAVAGRVFGNHLTVAQIQEATALVFAVSKLVDGHAQLLAASEEALDRVWGPSAADLFSAKMSRHRRIARSIESRLRLLLPAGVCDSSLPAMRASAARH